MTQLGLGEESDGAMLATDADQPITVSMTTPNGVVKMETNTIRIRPGADHAVDHIDIFVTHPDLPAANQKLRKAADELGFAALSDAEPLDAASSTSSQREKWYAGLGNRTGTVYSVEISSSPDTGRSTFVSPTSSTRQKRQRRSRRRGSHDGLVSASSLAQERPKLTVRSIGVSRIRGRTLR